MQELAIDAGALDEYLTDRFAQARIGIPGEFLHPSVPAKTLSSVVPAKPEPGFAEPAERATARLPPKRSRA